MLVNNLVRLKYRTRRPHRFLILSCYIDFDAIKQIIIGVDGELRLVQVCLAFEFKEAFRKRLPNEMVTELERLRVWCQSRGVELEWHALRGGALMHAKGYAVVQLVDGEPAAGVLLIGSANATIPGLGFTALSPVNFELMHLSEDENDVNDFLNIWEKLIQKSRNLNQAAGREDEYEFRYGLLASGVFLHDWRESLNSKIGITYSLTKEGRRALPLNAELKMFGFDIDQATISRNPFKGFDVSRTRELPRTFSRKYTIDTLVGRWCPRSIWSVVESTVEGDIAFVAFYDAFIRATIKQQLDFAYDTEAELSVQLVARGLIVEDNTRLDRWKVRIETLRNDRDRLVRIYKRLEAFGLPYDYQARDEVLEVWDSLFSTLEARHNTSFVAQKIQDANSEGNLDVLGLSENEKTTLRSELAS